MRWVLFTICISVAAGGGFGAGWMLAVRQGALKPMYEVERVERIYLENPRPVYQLPPKDDLSHLNTDDIRYPENFHIHDGYLPHDEATRH